MAQLTHPKTAASPTPPRTAPGPRGNLLLGSYPEFRRHPTRFLTRAWREYGDVVRIRFAAWYGHLLAHPDYAQYILQDHNRNYTKELPEYQRLSWIMGNGLLTSSGDFWLRQRRLAQPAFHRRRIAGFGRLMTAAAEEMMAGWQTAVADGRPLDISQEMMRVTLRIVGQALFSFDTREQADVVGDAFTLVNEYVSVDADAPWGGLVHRLPTARRRQFDRAMSQLDEVVNGIIAARRRGAETAVQDDLLAMLMAARDEETGEGMTDHQLRDEVMTLMLAGHETTANALTWTLYLLSKNPDVLRRLQAELDRVLDGRLPTIDDLSSLPFTRMVIEEGMRLYPPAWSLPRKAVEEDVIGGYQIPAGSPVFLDVYIIHRHPDFWDNPEGFDPERFSPERSQGRHRYAYMPFGGGPRMCIGNNFAMLEAHLLLATIAARYELHLVPGHPIELEPLITLRPRHGMLMHIHERGQG